MSTTPASPATPAAAAPPPAPPSAPASTPAAPVAPAQASTPAAPQAPAPSQAPKLEDFDGNTPAYVEAHAKWRREEREKQAATAETTPAAEEAPAEALPEGERPPEEVAPAGDETQAPAAETAPPAEEDLTKAPDGLDLQGGLSAIELNEKLKASPELDKLVQADPEFKGALFRNARLAEKAAPYEELFGADGIEGAKAAVHNASTWVDIDRRFLGATTPEGVNDVINFWAEQATYVDEQGNKIQKLDANGKPVMWNNQPVYEMAPSFGFILQRIRDSQIDAMLPGAKARNDLELMDAIRVIKARIAGAASPSDDEEDIPEHIKQKEAQLAQREREFNRQESERQTKEREQYESSVETDIDEAIDALVSPVLEKANLSEFIADAAWAKIARQIGDSLESNRFFQSRLAELYALRPSTETQKRIRHLVAGQVQGVAGPIVRKVLAEAAQGVVTKATDKIATVRSQEARTRATEPRSTAGPASAVVPQQTPEQLLAQAEKQFEEQKGYKPGPSDMSTVLEIWAGLKKAQKGTRAS